MRDNAEKLKNILEAIERIERYAVLGKENFEANELVQVWMTQNLLSYWRSISILIC